MSRFPSPLKERGSQKWIQLCVNGNPALLDGAILPSIGASKIDWRSPLASDDYAEYRDGAFLDRLGLSRFESALREFWPARGPQWDALALSDKDDVLLIEAKAHLAELRSPATQASPASRAQILAALDSTIKACGAKPDANWADMFFQLANRLAHLHFLRRNGVNAWLVLVNFVGDADMKGPSSREEWETAYRQANDALGLSENHLLSQYVLHIYPDVRAIA